MKCGHIPAIEPTHSTSIELFTRQRPQFVDLKKSVSWTLVSSVIYAGCQWGIIVSLARLGPEYVGQFAMGVAITGPVMLFTNLHLRAVQATDACERFCFHDYLGLRILLTTIALLAIFAISISAGYARETLLVVMAVASAKAIESYSDVYYGLLQRNQNMGTIACSMILRGVGALIAFSVVAHWTGSLTRGILAMSGIWLAVLIAFDLPSGAKALNVTIRKACQPRMHIRSLCKLASVAFPVGLVASVISLELNVPRYFLESLLGNAELGIFAAIAYVLVAVNTVINAIHQPIVPRLADHFSQGDHVAFRQLAFKLIGFSLLWGICGVALVILIGRWGLNVIYGEEYSQHHNVFVLLMIANAVRFGSLGIGTALRAMQRFWWQSAVHLPGIVFIVILCPLLIRQFGMQGAAYSILFTVLFEALIYGGLALLVFPKPQKLGGVG